MLKFNDKSTDGRLNELRSQEEERLVQSLAPQYGFNYVNLKGYTINPNALSKIPEETARTAEVVAFDMNQKTLSVAAKNPNDPKAQEVFTSLQNQRFIVDVYMCSTGSLEHAWKRYADLNATEASKRGVFEISAEDIKRLTDRITHKDEILLILQEINTKNNTRRISETLELMFAGAMALGASDIHVEPEQSAVRLRYRFDGVLHDIANIDSYMHGRILSRLKLLSGMVLNTKAEAQDGRFTFDLGEKVVEIRSSVIPGAIGESIVMRLLDPTVASFTLERIKLNRHIEGVIKQQLKKPNGLIITTGPTGSGKTTTLYAFLQEVHNEGVKIITIENPVEYKLDGIVQTQTDADYTFSSGLRSILRQDPDIIMVGEIRDHEVAKTAFHAANTGHLVFSTLHTNSAVGGFPRLIDLGIDPRIFGSTINIMMGQRLVRILCEHCKTAIDPTDEDRILIEYVMEKHPHPVPVPSPLKLYQPNGCKECGGTGFKGRMGIFEGIVMDDKVEEVVIRDPRESVILEAAAPQGIPTMVEDGIEKVVEGDTSLAELERVIELPRQIASAVTPQEPTTEPKPADLDDTFKDHVV